MRALTTTLRTTGRTLHRLSRNWRARHHDAPEQASVRALYNPLERLDVDHSLGPPPDGVSWPVSVVLRDDEGQRAVYRVFGYDVARADPDDQAQWTATYETFVNACRGWRVSWHTRLSRNRMEEHFGRALQWVAQGKLSPEAAALVTERVTWQRESVAQQFLGKYECWLAVPAPEGEDATLADRCEEVEPWLDKLGLAHYRLDFVEQVGVLAAGFNVEAPTPAALAPFLIDHLDPVAVTRDGPPLYRPLLREAPGDTVYDQQDTA